MALARTRLLAVPFALALAAGAPFAPPAAAADDLPDALDADALALEAEPEPAPSAAGSGDSKLFVEGAWGRADRRYGLDSRSVGRASLDWRDATRWSQAWRSVASIRLDATRPSDDRIDNPVLSLREAYVGWQGDAAASGVELGRVNLREGPGYGFNPTDFLRADALRTITSANPFTLRENRLGTVMLRGQHLWRDYTLEALVAPKLDDAPSTHRFSADLGATNDRSRIQVALGTRFSEAWSARWLIHDADGESPQVGASTTALLSDAAVGHAEWSWGRARTLRDRALGLRGDADGHHRAAAGLTYTTSTKLSLTGEYQYNGAALDRDGWRALAADPAAAAAYFTASTAWQDNAARQAWMLYAVQRDLLLKNLELTGIVKWNRSDRSRMAWVELSYQMDHADIALQLQFHHGEPWSEFGILTNRRSAQIVGTVYF